MDNQIFNSYAIALLDYAIESKKEEILRNEIKEIRVLLKENPSFKMILSSKNLKIEDKYSLIDKVFVSCDKSIKSYIKVIVKNNLSFHLYEIIRETLYRLDDYLNIEEGFLYIPKEFKKEEIELIKKEIEKRTNKRVDLEVVIDSTLIGGFKVSLRNNEYDASLKGKLDDFKLNILKE